MTKGLQQALSNVKSPKIGIEKIRGSTYQAQAVSVKPISQTNYAGTLTGLMKLGSDSYASYVQNQWSKAESDFNEAAAKPEFDELKMVRN